jgi:hypothetical protein
MDAEGIKREPNGRIARGSRAINPAGTDIRKARMLNQLNQLTPRAITRLAKLMDSDDEKVAIVAVKEILDRNLGKPKASLDMKIESSMSALHLQSLVELASRARERQAERMIDVTPNDTATPMLNMIEAITNGDDQD